MRLIEVTEMEERLHVRVDDEGARGAVSVEIPEGWGVWGRDAKIQWVKAWVEQHERSHSYLGAGKAVFPDPAARGAALDGFASLPGFASWTAQEAAEWIEANVIDIETAKSALARMARAIVYLRDAMTIYGDGTGATG